jgi:hypothetical protein
MIELNYDFKKLDRLGNALSAARDQLPVIMMRAVNHTGAKARTAMIKVLVKQTGLKRKTILRALITKNASPGGTFVIDSKGGNVRLKFFAPRETRAGVTAAPWSKRRLYPHTFMKGGKFPNRVKIDMGDQVLRRLGKHKFPVAAARSGLYIPTEMVSGASEAAFNSTVDNALPGRIAHELYRVIGK